MSIDKREGRRYALEVLQGFADRNPHAKEAKISELIANLEATAKVRPEAYASGIRGVIAELAL